MGTPDRFLYEAQPSGRGRSGLCRGPRSVQGPDRGRVSPRTGNADGSSGRVSCGRESSPLILHEDLAALPAKGGLMGLDPGSKTIGVAVSDGLRLTATA